MLFRSYTGNQNKMAAKCTAGKLLLKARGLLADSHGLGGVATDKRSWTNGARASKSEVIKTTKQVADTDTKYFISKYEVQATILVDGESTTGFGDIYKPWGPGFDGTDDTNGLEYTLSIGWPRATLQDGQAVVTTGTLSADNTATDPKPAGSTSKVGSNVPSNLRIN